jgi:hypothetical protein
MGDAPREQKRYLSWARRSAGHAGVTSPARPGSLPDAALHMITRLGREYYRQLYGDALQPPSPALPLASRVVRTLDVHDLVGDSIDDHWRLLVEFLGFRFSELAFGFSESDCANPVLMAHLRGLLAEFAQQREYTDGVHEYLRLAATLMRRKGMSEHLIELAHSAYDNPTKIDLRRQLANRHAREGFGLNEIQLVCLVCSPFVGQGAALEPFLRRCHPGMLVALPYLHKALQGYPTPEAVTQWLVDTSGLPIIALQRLYLQEPVHFDDERSLIAQVRAGDPDKARINTLDRVTGETITVLMSGR